MIRRPRRKGVTLTEVLIALFVMAIGILALMSMFPAAAVQMAQAVKDDRTATLAANSETMAKVFWRAAWQSPQALGGLETNEANVFAAEPAFQALDDPGSGLPALSPTYSGCSYPVFIDPIGFNAWSTGSGKNWVGSSPSFYFPRRSLKAITTSGYPTAACIRFCSVLDDMTFNNKGLPDTSNVSIDRGGRFSVAWVLQRRQNNIRLEPNVTVVVYQNRPPAVTPTGENAYVATVTNGTTSIQLNGATNANIRRGSWVVDVTPISNGGQTEYRADFYRVVSYAKQGANMAIELQNPVRLNPGVTANANYTGTFLILDNVVEVFDRGTLSAVGAPAP